MDIVISQHITPKEAGKLLAYSADTIIRMIKDGQIDGLPVRNSWSVPVASLQEYMATRTLKAKKVKQLQT